MADMGQLVVQLELQQAQFTKGMNDAAKRLERLGQEAKKSQSGLNDLVAGFNKLKTAVAQGAAAFGAFKSVEAIAKAGDAVRNLQGSFTALLGDAGRAADMMTKVFGIVERTGAPLEAVSGATQRLTIALRDLGASNNQIATIAETFIQLGKVGGASAAETAAALQQLGQALASGKLGGDELRSIRENAPLVADAIAKAMGVTSGALKQLGEDGKLTADVVANALLKASTDAAASFAKLPQSFEQALNRMEAQATLFGAALDTASQASGVLKETTDFIATNLKRWTDELNNSKNEFSLIGMAAEALKLAMQALLVILTDIAFTAEVIARALAAATVEAYNLLTFNWSVMGEAWKTAEAQSARARAELDEYHRKVLQLGQDISKVMGKVFGDQETGGFPLVAPRKIAPGKGTPAGGGKGEDKAAKELEQLKERAKAIAASLVPAEQYNQTMAELDKLMAKQLLTQEVYNLAKGKATELLNAEANAVRAMIDPYFTYNKEMEKLNKLYMEQKIEVEELIKAQEMLKKKADEAAGMTGKKIKTMTDYAEELGETLGSAGGQFFSDIIEGSATAAEAFEKFAKTILSKIAEMVAAAAAAWIVKSLFGGAAGAAGAPAGNAATTSANLARVAANTNLATFGGMAQSRTGSGATTTAGSTISGNQTRPELKVVVNNLAGADVSTRQDESGNLEITIDRVRRALATDVRRGGNVFSDSLERSFTMARRGA